MSIIKKLSISFIIPAFNEELFLPHVLANISKYTPDELPYEVIVADNGSVDSTVALAEKAGAKVLIDQSATIGGLRNLAVDESSGEILVFLDADILLTQEWTDNIVDVFASLLDNPYQVTGSRCGVPENSSWIEDVWFKPLANKSTNYINSGHLVVSRKLFDKVGGFNADLETGEDYAFGQAVLQANAVVVNNPLLAVVHKGYPKTIYQFVRRESWHGRGDCESLSGLMSSKVAQASIIFVILHIFLIIGFVTSAFALQVISILIILSVCLVASKYKHGAQPLKNMILVGFLYYLYFFSRFFSCISFMSSRSVKRIEGG